MNKELYEQMCSLLSKPNSNKADIARKTGVSGTVRKYFGGYDRKYGNKPSLPTPAKELPPSPVTKTDEQVQLPLTPPKPHPPQSRKLEVSLASNADVAQTLGFSSQFPF